MSEYSPELTNQVNVCKTVVESFNSKVVGQKQTIEKLLIALLVNGHVLLEGVPGLAKTTMLATLGSSLSATFQRIQFTPDLMPSDIIGTEIYTPSTGEFSVRHGPIFANFVLADEINRAPAKVQSALLEAMAESQVSIGGNTFELPKPFMVLATQNPLEQTGTYELPEAQLDRFLMKIIIDYPSYEEEIEIISRYGGGERESQPVQKTVINPEMILVERSKLNNIHVDPKIDDYIVRLVQASRQYSSRGSNNLGNSDSNGSSGNNLKGLNEENIVEWGASPRAGIALRKCARAVALLADRHYVIPDDIKQIAPDILRHRIILTLEADATDITSDDYISYLLDRVPLP